MAFEEVRLWWDTLIRQLRGERLVGVVSAEETEMLVIGGVWRLVEGRLHHR